MTFTKFVNIVYRYIGLSISIIGLMALFGGIIMDDVCETMLILALVIIHGINIFRDGWVD